MNIFYVDGIVSTTPRHLVTNEGLSITSFRLANTNDKNQETNWYTVTLFNELAIRAQTYQKGTKVLLSGNVSVRNWDNGEQTGTSVEIEARTITDNIIQGPPTPRHSCSCSKCHR